jgi:hypothetical protein
MHCKHNPPCESPWAELVHGVIEWSAGVFADHDASSHEYPLLVVYCSGDFGLKLDRAVDKGFVRKQEFCFQKLISLPFEQTFRHYGK